MIRWKSEVNDTLESLMRANSLQLQGVQLLQDRVSVMSRDLTDAYERIAAMQVRIADLERGSDR